MKQTAVELLVEKLWVEFGFTISDNIYDEVLEIEKQQMKDAWESSDTNMRNQFSSSAYKAITFNQWFEKFENK